MLENVVVLIIVIIIIVISLVFIFPVIYCSFHTEDGRGYCRNMFVKLRSVVFFLKLKMAFNPHIVGSRRSFILIFASRKSNWSLLQT